MIREDLKPGDWFSYGDVLRMAVGRKSMISDRPDDVQFKFLDIEVAGHDAWSVRTPSGQRLALAKPPDWFSAAWVARAEAEKHVRELVHFASVPNPDMPNHETEVCVQACNRAHNFLGHAEEVMAEDELFYTFPQGNGVLEFKNTALEMAVCRFTEQIADLAEGKQSYPYNLRVVTRDLVNQLAESVLSAVRNGQKDE